MMRYFHVQGLHYHNWKPLADVREKLYKGSDTEYVTHTLPSGHLICQFETNKFFQWVIWFIESDTEVGGANLASFSTDLLKIQAK